jgi:hypothetical protein
MRFFFIHIQSLGNCILYGRLYKKKQEGNNHKPNTLKTDVQRMYEANFLRNYKMVLRQNVASHNVYVTKRNCY